MTQGPVPFHLLQACWPRASCTVEQGERRTPDRPCSCELVRATSGRMSVIGTMEHGPGDTGEPSAQRISIRYKDSSAKRHMPMWDTLACGSGGRAERLIPILRARLLGMQSVLTTPLQWMQGGRVIRGSEGGPGIQFRLLALLRCHRSTCGSRGQPPAIACGHTPRRPLISFLPRRRGCTTRYTPDPGWCLQLWRLFGTSTTLSLPSCGQSSRSCGHSAQAQHGSGGLHDVPGGSRVN
jgi:hypothetical protein